MSNVERIDAVSSHNPAHLVSGHGALMGQMRMGTAQPRPLPTQKSPSGPQAEPTEATFSAETGEPGHQASDADAPLGESAGIEPVSPYPVASLADLRHGAALGWLGMGSTISRLPVLPGDEADLAFNATRSGYTEAGSSWLEPNGLATDQTPIRTMHHSDDHSYDDDDSYVDDDYNRDAGDRHGDPTPGGPPQVWVPVLPPGGIDPDTGRTILPPVIVRRLAKIT